MPTPKRILVVDDEVNLTKTIRLFLERAGYSVYVANSGLEALRQIREHYFDMILLDLNMPEMDGIHIAKITKQNRPETKIIVVTGRKDQYEEELRTIQINDLVQKPIPMTELVEKVKQMLGESPSAPRVVGMSGIPKAKLLFVEHGDSVYTHLFSPYFKQLNDSKKSDYQMMIAEDTNKALSLVRLYQPDIVLLNTNMIDSYSGILKEFQDTRAIPKEIIVHGKELYAKSPDALGLDRNIVTAIEGGVYNEDYPRRLEEAVREIALRHGLVVAEKK